MPWDPSKVVVFGASAVDPGSFTRKALVPGANCHEPNLLAMVAAKLSSLMSSKLESLTKGQAAWVVVDVVDVVVVDVVVVDVVVVDVVVVDVVVVDVLLVEVVVVMVVEVVVEAVDVELVLSMTTNVFSLILILPKRRTIDAGLPGGARG